MASVSPVARRAGYGGEPDRPPRAAVVNAALSGGAEAHVARNFVGGRWRLPRHGYEIDVYAPTSIEELGSVPRSAAADVDDALDAARGALHHDLGLVARQRAWKFCELLRTRAERIARVEHLDSGVPLDFATRSILESVAWLEGRLERPTPGAEDAGCGCSAWLLPAYAPFWLYCTQVLEALLGGDAVVLKPSSSTPLSAVCFAEILADLDLPAGSFALLQGTGGDAGTALARSPKVDRLTFVGGRDAARMVMRSAAQPLTPCAILTGNLNPSVVYADGDVGLLARVLAATLFAHAGQGGFASRWCLVPEARLAEMREALQGALDALDAGGGWGRSVAPLVSEDRRERVLRFLGALGPHAPESMIGTRMRPSRHPMGYFVSPSVVIDPTPDALARGADLPGPVLLLSTYRSEDAMASMLASSHGRGALGVYSARGAAALSPLLARGWRNVRVNGAPTGGACAAESLWCGFHQG